MEFVHGPLRSHTSAKLDSLLSSYWWIKIFFPRLREEYYLLKTEKTSVIENRSVYLKSDFNSPQNDQAP